MKTVTNNLSTVNSLQNENLWDRHEVSILERVKQRDKESQLKIEGVHPMGLCTR